MTVESTGQHFSADRGPAVVGRPILVVLAALALGSGLKHLLPLPAVVPGSGAVHWTSAAIGAGLLLAGLALAISGIGNLSRAGTAVPTNRPASALVVTGIHGWTRNPVYLGFLLLCAGIGLLVRDAWMLIIMAPLAIYLRYGVVAREETYLEQRFGDAYGDYRSHVGRWI